MYGTTTVEYLWETHMCRHYTPKASQERRGRGGMCSVPPSFDCGPGVVVKVGVE